MGLKNFDDFNTGMGEAETEAKWDTKIILDAVVNSISKQTGLGVDEVHKKITEVNDFSKALEDLVNGLNK